MEPINARLHEHTFRLHGKPLTFVQNSSQQAALAFLNKTYSDEHGLGIFEGPTLIGKTTVLQKFVEGLPRAVSVAAIDCRNQDVVKFLESVLEQFGFNLEEPSVNEQMKLLEVFLVQQTSSHHTPLLLIENAHALCHEERWAVSQLIKTLVGGRSALRVILISNRSLDPVIDSLAGNGIDRQMFGRFLLGPMTADETANYVYAKLRAGGCESPENIVSEHRCDELFEESGGNPGLVDRLMLIRLKKSAKLRRQSKPQQGPLPHDPPLLAIEEKSPGCALVSDSDHRPELIVSLNGKVLQRVRLNRERFLIGRSDFNDITINSSLISRHHAMLVRKDGATVLLDLNSTNGVFVNRQYTICQVLQHNDVISLGSHNIKIIDESAAARTEIDGLTLDETSTMKALDDRRRLQAKKSTHVL